MVKQWIAGGCLVGLLGCAQAAPGNPVQPVAIDSIPSGATCTVNARETVTTPATVSLTASAPARIVCRTAGYRETAVTLVPNRSNQSSYMYLAPVMTGPPSYIHNPNRAQARFVDHVTVAMTR